MADEYINRAATIEALENKCLYMSIRECPGDCEICEEKAISRIPAADVAPVVHAHWEDVSVDDEGSRLIASMFCPVCKQWHSEVCVYGKPTKMAHYCPNCGAKMDESEGDGE